MVFRGTDRERLKRNLDLLLLSVRHTASDERGTTTMHAREYSIYAAPARAGAPVQNSGVCQPHPHLLAHVFQINGFSWEYFGSWEDFWYGDAQKTP
jgi:hypothetical protein